MEKSVFPIMYSNSIIEVSASRSTCRKVVRGRLGDAPLQAPGQVTLGLEEQAIARGDRLAAHGIDVGAAGQPHAERSRGEEIEDPVGEVLAQGALLVLLRAVAMRAELQRAVALERRPFRGLARELEAKGNEAAVLYQAGMAARAQA